MNNENLKPNTERTPSERRELARKAGKASGVRRKQLKTFKELTEYFGSLPAIEADKKFLEGLGMKVDGMMSMDMVVIAAQYAKARKGDTRAAAYLREARGEAKQQVDVNGDLKVIISGAGEGMPARTSETDE